ncbi:hypothetical protein ACFL2G_01065 [Candidatus Omnitrophota bacterium]
MQKRFIKLISFVTIVFLYITAAYPAETEKFPNIHKLRPAIGGYEDIESLYYSSFRKDLINGKTFRIFEVFETKSGNLTKDTAVKLIDTAHKLYLSRRKDLRGKTEFKDLLEKMEYILHSFIYGAIAYELNQRPEGNKALKEIFFLTEKRLAEPIIKEYFDELDSIPNEKDKPEKIIEYLIGNDEYSIKGFFEIALLNAEFVSKNAIANLESMLGNDKKNAINKTVNSIIESVEEIQGLEKLERDSKITIQDDLKNFVDDAILNFKQLNHEEVSKAILNIDNKLASRDLTGDFRYSDLYDEKNTSLSFFRLLPALAAEAYIIDSTDNEYIEFLSVLENSGMKERYRNKALEALLAFQALKLKQNNKPCAAVRIRLGLGELWSYLNNGYVYNIRHIPPLPPIVEKLDKFIERLSVLRELKEIRGIPNGVKSKKLISGYARKLKNLGINITEILYKNEKQLISEKSRILKQVNLIKLEMISNFLQDKYVETLQSMKEMTELVKADIKAAMYVATPSDIKKLLPVLLAQSIIVNSTVKEYRDFVDTLNVFGYSKNEAMGELRKLVVTQALKSNNLLTDPAAEFLRIPAIMLRDLLEDEYISIISNIPISLDAPRIDFEQLKAHKIIRNSKNSTAYFL